MFCPQCGSKLAEGARFCPQCGARVGADADEQLAENTPAEHVEPDEGPAARGSLASRLIEFRRTTLRAVPTFVIGLVAALLFAGTAYALYRVATDIIIPMVQEWTEPQGQNEAQPEEPPTEEEPDEQELLNEQAHAAYEKVLDEYRAYYENADPVADSTTPGDNPSYPNVYWSAPNAEVSLETLSYTYADLDGDGIDELLLSFPRNEAAYSETGEPIELPNNLWAGYTYNNGEITCFFQRGYRQTVTLCSDGTLGITGVDGFALYTYQWAQLENGALQTLETVSCSGVLSNEPLQITHTVGGNEETTTDAWDGQNVFSSARFSELVSETAQKHPDAENVTWSSVM